MKLQALGRLKAVATMSGVGTQPIEMPTINLAKIEIKPSHRGKLHKYLGIPEDQEIPVSKLKALMDNKDPEVVKMANFALNARNWKH